MRKSTKENIQLPHIGQRFQLEIYRGKQLAKPKLQRIFYSPVPQPSRQSNKMTLLESIVNNKDFDDLKDQIKEKQIEQLLRETKRYLLEKQQRMRTRVGKQAQLKYYENYKKLDKIISKRRLQGSVSSFQQDPSMLILEATENQKVLPCCIGFIKTKGQPSILNLNGHKFGDKYIKAMSIGLKQSKIIENCQFSNNRLTDQGLSEITNNLSNQIIKLDLSENKITKIDEKLLNLLVEPEARLQYLNLANNLLSDRVIQTLCTTASFSRHLKYLNIRKNILTKVCAQSVSELIQKSTSLEQLYLGMNRITEQGANLVLASLEENKYIKVFDYSMNQLGQSNPSTAKSLANVLNSNKSLVHVDFSSNNYNQQESKIIAEKLDKNKKIYGFHFSGNYGYVDSKGFLKIQKKPITSLHSIVNRPINSYDITFRREAVCMQPQKYTNVCWICEGWYEQTFKFVVPEPRQDGKNFVFLHFDFQQFQPRLINISDVKVKYKTMVPPRKYRYFFTWNNFQYTDVHFNGTNKSLPQKNAYQQNLVIMQIPLTYTYEMNHELVTFTVSHASSRAGKPKKIVNNWDEIIVSILPRQEGLINKKEKKPWSYKDSLWAKQWKLQDQSLTKNCFQKDWKTSKLSNLIKSQSEQDKVKQILYKNYKLIKELYRHYASWSPFNSDIWAVSNNAFTQFCYLAKIISKDTPLTIIDLTFITTNSISGTDFKGNSLVPERGLVRFQFMQGLVRLSEEKFKKNGLTDSILDSVISMMRDHIQPLQANPICNSQKWRLQKYFCEENDILVKKYRIIFTQIYKKNSKLKVKPGNKPFMCLAEFKSVIERIGIAATLVLERDIFLSFSCSMMTQVDQLENERFIRMTEIQFIEAVARCAYILPNTSKIEDIFGDTTPFYGKFEWIIHELKMLCSDEVKNSFPAQSLFNKSDDD